MQVSVFREPPKHMSADAIFRMRPEIHIRDEHPAHPWRKSRFRKGLAGGSWLFARLAHEGQEEAVARHSFRFLNALYQSGIENPHTAQPIINLNAS